MRACSLISQRNWGLVDLELVFLTYKKPCSVIARSQETCLFFLPPSHCHWFKCISPPSPHPHLPLPPPPSCPCSSIRIQWPEQLLLPATLKIQLQALDLIHQLIPARHSSHLQPLHSILFLAVIQHPPHIILRLGEIWQVFLYLLSPGQCQLIHRNPLLDAGG